MLQYVMLHHVLFHHVIIPLRYVPLSHVPSCHCSCMICSIMLCSIMLLFHYVMFHYVMFHHAVVPSWFFVATIGARLPMGCIWGITLNLRRALRLVLLRWASSVSDGDGRYFSGDVWSLHLEGVDLSSMLQDASDDGDSGSSSGLSLLHIALAVSIMASGICMWAFLFPYLNQRWLVPGNTSFLSFFFSMSFSFVFI